MKRVRNLVFVMCLGISLFFLGCSTEQIAQELQKTEQLQIEIVLSPSQMTEQGEAVKDSVDVVVKITGGSGVGLSSIQGYIQDEGHPLILSPAGNDSWIGRWDTNSGDFPNGKYAVLVAVTDNAGDIFSNGKNYWVQNDLSAPVVRITNPLANSEITGTVTINAQASSPSGVISQVEFYLDNQKVATDSTEPFSYSWNSLSFSDKLYILKVKAIDVTGKTAEDTINVSVNNNLVPSVTLSAPLAGELLSGVKELKAEASAKNGKSITKVEFYANQNLIGTDSVAPYSYSWKTTLVANGNFAIFAKAYDNQGKIAQSESKTVTISNSVTPEDKSPVINFTSPTEGAEGLNGEITITSSITDDKALNKVELYLDNTLKKTYNLGGEKNYNLSYTVYGKVNDQAANASFSPLSDYQSAAAVDWQKVTNYGSDPGSLGMYMHVPADMPANAPLVVALHGCSQSATAYRDDTKWNVLADKYKFYVIYAEQTANMGCMYWFDTRRTSQAQSIANMVEYMKGKYSIDPKRVYVSGLSAGGGMTTNVLALHADKFAGGAPMAGLSYGATTSSMQTPQAGSTVTQCSGSNCPLVFVFQGTSDSMVAPGNADMIRKQWTKAHKIDDTADNNGSNLKGYPYEEYKDSNGNVRVAVVKITGMSHGISVDPNGTGTDAGGSSAGTWSHDKGLYSSYYAAKFWGIVDGETPPPADQAPEVTITAPANGAQNLQGVVTVTASATDDKALSKAEFYVNNLLAETKNIGGTQSNLAFSWNTGGIGNGAYTLKVKVYDSISQVKESTVLVTVGEALPELAEGQHTITIKAYDSAGLVSEKKISITIGVVLPELTITTPTGGEFTKPSTIAVTGVSKRAVKVEVRLVGASTGKEYSLVTLNKGDIPAGLDSWSAMLETSSVYMSGSYLVSAIAYDAQGNTSGVKNVTVSVKTGGFSF